MGLVIQEGQVCKYLITIIIIRIGRKDIVYIHIMQDETGIVSLFLPVSCMRYAE